MLVLLGLILVPGMGIGLGFAFAGLLVPLALLALVGLGAWWLASGGRIGDSPGAVLAAIGLGLALLFACVVVALVGAWAAGTGGGVVAAILVIAAGAAIAAGAFVRPLRVLILPALALALALGFVAAAGIDLDGGFGEREHHPAAGGDVRERYEVGAGRLVIDLRDVPGPELAGRTIGVGVGLGEAIVLVPEDVCVASRGEVGMGRVATFDDATGGVDVLVDDPRRAAPGRHLLVLDAQVGVGQVQVGGEDLASLAGEDRWDERGFDRPGLDPFDANRACAGAGA